jgi:NADH-quinone oxidoreductase subunit M
MLVVLVTALNGIAVLHAYFRLFTGTRHTTSVSLRSRWPEKFAVLLLTALILGGGLVPQPGVTSRYHAAADIIARRQAAMARPDETHVESSRAAGELRLNPPVVPESDSRSTAGEAARTRPGWRSES